MTHRENASKSSLKEALLDAWEEARTELNDGPLMISHEAFAGYLLDLYGRNEARLMVPQGSWFERVKELLEQAR